MHLLPNRLANQGQNGGRLKSKIYRRFCKDRVSFFYVDVSVCSSRKNAEILQDAEPFSLDSLDDYTLKQDLLEKGLQGINLRELFPYVRAKGVLPSQVPGEVRFRQLVHEVETYTESAIRPIWRAPKLEDLEIDCECAGFQLRGRLRDVYSKHLLRYRCADLKPKDRLAIWVEHFILNHFLVEGYPSESVLVGQDGVMELSGC